MRYFVPISEPLVILSPDAAKGEEVPYGVVCEGCGLSWRAEKTSKGCGGGSGGVRKMASLAKVKDLHRRALSPANGRLRKTQSFVALRPDGNEREADANKGEDRKDVASMSVRFSGIRCTCGSVSSLCSLCFRIETKHAVGLLRAGQHRPRHMLNETLLAMGNGEPEVRIREIKHPNPLRSCPIQRSDLIEAG